MVEFAVILPVLLVIGMSVFDYGYYLEHVNNIATVVRDGARYASLYTNPSYATQWNSACADPTTLASGGWSCAGMETTVAMNQPTQAIDPTSGTYIIDVASISGFSSYKDGFSVATTTSTGVAALLSCSLTATVSGQAEFTGCSATDPATGGGNLVPGASLIGQSDFTEGIIQEEAESLTVPEAACPSTTSTAAGRGRRGYGMSEWIGDDPPIARLRQYGRKPLPLLVAGERISSQPPVSCITISYWTSSDGSYSTSSLSLCGRRSADASSDTGQFESVNQCSATIGKLVQVTVAYDRLEPGLAGPGVHGPELDYSASRSPHRRAARCLW